MAKYAVILSVIFSLFLLSHARLPSNTDASVTETTPLSISSENDDKTTLLVLPNDKSDETVAADTIAAVGITRPLVAPFDRRLRPINRHFPRPSGRGPFPHRCRHHHHHHRHRHGEHRFEIPYGNDMIISSGGGGGNMRQIPYGDDMIGADGRPVRQREFGMHGERHVDGKQEEEEEEGGFGRWFREMLNRF